MNRILTYLAGLMIFLLIPLSSSAQGGYEVKGSVIDQYGPVVAATIMEQGTSTGTATDADGKFSLVVSSRDAIVEISCIGYATQTFQASAVPSKIILSEDTMFLEETVVIGYGSLSKKELSSSIVQVNADDFFKGSMNNPMEMLTGKVAGLNINTTAAANPNSNSSLQIRGATSLSASNSPLVVIDGVPGGDIRNIAPQDIESMTVLKDAASAAIYGTRGANGVILIQTRKGSLGEAGTANITYDSWFGVNFAKPHAEILSPDEFRRSMRGIDYGYDTDWYSLLMRDFSYDHNEYLAVDGSTKTGSYNASLNYKKATGLDIRSSREEFGGRVAVEQKAFKNRLQVGIALNARRVNEEWGNDGMFDTALTLNPTMPVYNEDGSWYQPTHMTDIRNPYQELVVNENNGQRLYLLGTASAKVNIITTDKHNLSTTVNYSLHYNDLKSNYYTPSTSAESFWGGYKGRANIEYQKWYINHVEWLGNYSLYLAEHSLQAVIGYSYEASNWEKVQAGNNDFTFDNFGYNNIGSGSFLTTDGKKASMSSGKSLSKLIGVFARVNYNWKDLLMASASIRYEGSTKFGANKKWGAFPSASLAWEIANMPFLKDAKAVQSIKPRVSYGVTGRSDFGAYQSLSTYSTNGQYFFDNEWVMGYAPSVNANPELGWEKLVSINAGVDFSFFGNRLRGSIDWFNRKSQDLLYNYTAPQPPYVWSNILVNVGTTTNTGVEVSIDGDIFAKKNFTWTMGLNYSYGTTELTKLSNDIYNASYVELYQKPGVGTSEYFFRIQEGSNVGQFYGYEWAGASETGDMMVYNKNGEPISAAKATADDKKYIGNGAPLHFLSWSNTFRYKNWDLNLFFRGAFDFEIFNMRKYGMGLQGCGTDNVLRDAYLKDAAMKSGGGVISSYFLESGDFFKLENVTLGYNFTPKKQEILKSLRVYLSAKNLFTLTKYSGNDPSIVSINGLTPSIDVSSAYPVATQLTLGLTMRF